MSKDQLGEMIRQQMFDMDGDADGVVTDWLIIGIRQTLEDTDTVTAVGTLMSDESMPMFKVLGMLDYATTAYRARVTRAAFEDGE